MANEIIVDIGLVAGGSAANELGIDIGIQAAPSTGPTATGALTLPVPTIAGVGKLTYKATGALTLPVPTIAGVGKLTNIGTGALTLPVPTIAGAGSILPVGTGALTLPVPTIAGVGKLIYKGTGALTLPVPTIAGAGSHGLPPDPGTGALTLPVPTIAGVGQKKAVGTGALTLPVPTIAGIGRAFRCEARGFLVGINLNGNPVIQPDTAGAKVALPIEQADIDEAFIDFIGTSAADDSRSLSSDTTEDDAKGGAIRIHVNGTTKWIRFYDGPS